MSSLLMDCFRRVVGHGCGSVPGLETVGSGEMAVSNVGSSLLVGSKSGAGASGFSVGSSTFEAGCLVTDCPL